MTVSINISRDEVMEAVAMRSAQLGAKTQTADNDAYRRVFAADADRELLNQYWKEACSTATTALKRWMGSSNAGADSWAVTLYASASYDASLNQGVKDSLQSFLVLDILSKWLRMTLPDQSAACAAEGTAMLADANTKLHYRKKPVRNTNE